MVSSLSAGYPSYVILIGLRLTPRLCKFEDHVVKATFHGHLSSVFKFLWLVQGNTQIILHCNEIELQRKSNKSCKTCLARFSNLKRLSLAVKQQLVFFFQMSNTFDYSGFHNRLHYQTMNSNRRKRVKKSYLWILGVCAVFLDHWCELEEIFNQNCPFHASVYDRCRGRF